MSTEKLAEEVLADKLAGMMSRNTLKQAGIMAGVLIGGVTLMDFMLKIGNEMHKQDMIHQARGKNKRELQMRRDSQLVREAYNYEIPYQASPETQVLDPQYGLVQKLYGERTGHTNSWGGRRY